MKERFVDVPENYDEIHREHGILGHRVLALGWRKINELSPEKAKKFEREKVETDLQFGGFLIFSCPVKCYSKSSVKFLKNASHAVVMITGNCSVFL